MDITALGSLGTESLCMRTHRTLLPGCADTGALALGCGAMWDTEGTAPSTGTCGVPHHMEDIEPLAWQDPAVGTGAQS